MNAVILNVTHNHPLSDELINIINTRYNCSRNIIRDILYNPDTIGEVFFLILDTVEPCDYLIVVTDSETPLVVMNIVTVYRFPFNCRVIIL